MVGSQLIVAPAFAFVTLIVYLWKTPAFLAFCSATYSVSVFVPQDHCPLLITMPLFFSNVQSGLTIFQVMLTGRLASFDRSIGSSLTQMVLAENVLQVPGGSGDVVAGTIVM